LLIDLFGMEQMNQQYLLFTQARFLFQAEPGLGKEQVLLIDLFGMEQMFGHMPAGEGDAFIVHKK